MKVQPLPFKTTKLNTPYSLQIDGDSNGVPEEVIPNVLITVPSDWEWIKPELCQNPISREEDLAIYWTNAATQYYGFLESVLSGTSEDEEIDNQSVEDQNPNTNLYLHVNPFDDGMHMFPGSLLTQFEKGSASLRLQSTFYSPFFGLSNSDIQNNQKLCPSSPIQHLSHLNRYTFKMCAIPQYEEVGNQLDWMYSWIEMAYGYCVTILKDRNSNFHLGPFLPHQFPQD